MKNLGKIVLFLLLLTTTIFASVSAKVSPSVVYEGESATYMLSMRGSDIQKPTLSDICGNDITATGSQTSIQSINGNYSKTYTLTYEFTPTKSCVIPAVAVNVDGKIEKSNSINLRVKKMQRDPNADFLLTFKSNKKELYVGEPFTLTLLLKQRKDAQAVDSKFIAPEFKGFWKKAESKPERSDDGEFITTKVLYTLAPQRAGKLTLHPAKLKIATRVGGNSWNTFAPQVRWRTYISNSVEILAKVLPNNLKLIGNFTINAVAQKRVVHPNEAVNVTIEVKGDGNLEDIENFKPYIDGVNVFDEKIEIKGNTLHQKLVFVGDKDFTIPAFKILYFDPVTKKIKKIKTEPIEIKVRGAAKTTAPLKVTRDTTTQSSDLKSPLPTQKIVVAKNNYWYIAFAFLSGLLIGVILMLFKPKFGKEKVKKFNPKDKKLLLIKLLPYRDEDEDVAKVVKVLEGNIYGKSQESLDKKLLKELIKRYNLV